MTSTSDDSTALENVAWGSTTQYFYELTPDRILQAVESTGRKCTGRVIALNSMENRVYEIELLAEKEDERSTYIIAKFYRPGRWTKEQIAEEHQFLCDLHEYDIPVVPPLKGDNNSTLWNDPETGIHYALFPKVRGRSPEEFTNEQLLRMGRLIARMHNVGAVRRVEHRITLDVETYGWQNRDFLLECGLLPDDLQDRYADITAELIELIEPLFENVSMQRIHGDCHLGNIIWNDTGPILVDFDDMVSGPCVQDLWLFLRGRRNELVQDFNLLLEGYESMREFDRRELELIEPLRALRYIHFSAWIAKRWKDPAFSRAFTEFGTEEYWREQIRDLQEQIEQIA